MGVEELRLLAESARRQIGNWLATVPSKGYFPILGLYGPTEAAIDKSRKPGDIETVM